MVVEIIWLVFVPFSNANVQYCSFHCVIFDWIATVLEFNAQYTECGKFNVELWSSKPTKKTENCDVCQYVCNMSLMFAYNLNEWSHRI